MKDKILPPQESFLYDLFNAEEEQQQKEPFSLQFIDTDKFEEITEDMIKKFENKTSFVKDVISGEKQVYFFDIPKLGSQFGAKLQVHTFLNNETFDSYMQQIDEYEQKKQENIDLVQKLEEEYQEKMQNLELESQEYQDLMQEKQEKLDQVETINEPIPKSIMDQYLIVFDNQGQDEYFEQKDVDKMRKFCLFLENKWNEKNYLQLSENLKMYKMINKEFDMEQFMDEEEQILNQIGEFDKIPNEKSDQNEKDNLNEQKKEDDLQNMQQDIDQLEEFDQDQYIQEIIRNLGNQDEQNKFQDYYLQEFKFQKYLQQYQKYLPQIQQLVNLKFIKFSDIFQQAMFLQNKHKNEVNFENTNLFDWRKFQQKGFEELNKLIELYQYEGLKTGEFLQYNKVNVIQNKVEKFDEEKIKEFSYYLFIFLRLLKNLINLRIQNVLKRQKEFQIYNQIRERQIQLKELREEKKKSELKIAKEEFYASIDNQEDNEDEEQEEKKENEGSQEVQDQQKQSETFNEEQWEIEWKQENPEIEIPKELEAQMDDDFTKQFFEELQNNDNQSQQFIQRNILYQNHDWPKSSPFLDYEHVKNVFKTNNYQPQFLTFWSILHFLSHYLVISNILTLLHLSIKQIVHRQSNQMPQNYFMKYQYSTKYTIYLLNDILHKHNYKNYPYLKIFLKVLLIFKIQFFLFLSIQINLVNFYHSYMLIILPRHRTLDLFYYLSFQSFVYYIKPFQP